jgi:hypothetical protein
VQAILKWIRKEEKKGSLRERKKIFHFFFSSLQAR